MKRIFALISVFLTLTCSDNGPRENEFPVREAAVNGSAFRYRVFIPKGRDPNAKIPVMLYLHGSGGRGHNNRDQLGGFPEWIDANPDRFQFAIVFPQCPENTFWTEPQIEKALAALDQTVIEINGDPARLYLAGYSMGGFGAWQTAIAHPDKFAALVSVAGGVEALGAVLYEDRSLLSTRVKAAESADDVFRAYAEELKTLPVWIVHGDKDDSVPVEQSRKLSAALKAAGAKDVNYFELANAGHAIIGRTFQDEQLFEWLKRKSK